MGNLRTRKGNPLWDNTGRMGVTQSNTYGKVDHSY
jgi:hypothetical protein